MQQSQRGSQFSDTRRDFPPNQPTSHNAARIIEAQSEHRTTATICRWRQKMADFSRSGRFSGNTARVQRPLLIVSRSLVGVGSEGWPTKKRSTAHATIGHRELFSWMRFCSLLLVRFSFSKIFITIFPRSSIHNSLATYTVAFASHFRVFHAHF